MVRNGAIVIVFAFCATALSTAFCAAPVSASIAATHAAILRTAQADQAPASVQEVNPSTGEPMMLGPTPDEDAANYRRDFLACDSQSGERRETCRETVDKQYRPEVTNLSGSCESLGGTAKAECLKRNAPEK